MNWIDANLTKPDDKRVVLAFNGDGCWLAAWDADDNLWYHANHTGWPRDEIFDGTMTHWMDIVPPASLTTIR